mmetsp:Transcript_68160/g.127260  ORF Transcript_68160/g.127260 Transcript_68160/m.127260 type:complete len:147 (-) Transcript_68160:137-577(-)
MGCDSSKDMQPSAAVDQRVRELPECLQGTAWSGVSASHDTYDIYFPQQGYRRTHPHSYLTVKMSGSGLREVHSSSWTVSARENGAVSIKGSMISRIHLLIEKLPEEKQGGEVWMRLTYSGVELDVQRFKVIEVGTGGPPKTVMPEK